MDKVSSSKRSEIMSKIKSKDSKIEILFRKKLWEIGVRYRKNNVKYFGKPDIIIKKFKMVIFIDSCFWHGCQNHCRLPTTNKFYWENKINRNIERDVTVVNFYKKQGWNIFRFWEHDLRSNIDSCIYKVISKMK